MDSRDFAPDVMDPAIALSVVEQACARFQGTLADHQQVQAALQALRDIVVPPPEESDGADS